MHLKISPFPVLLFIASLNGFSQTIKVVPPAPNAMKMTEYAGQRPNMYTGTANVSIPLYSIDFDGWELPLSIAYNASGIRTGEEASEVGLGWSLNATAVISRTVRGGDDFFKGTLNGNGRGRGYAYNRVPIPVPFTMGYDQFTTTNPSPTSYYAHLAAARPDTQPDVFNYNFFGYSGQFILSQKVESPDIIAVGDPNIGSPITAIKLTEDATSIIFNESLLTFTIITPSGFKGEFTAKERSTSLTGNREAISKELACGEDKIDAVYLQNESGQLRTITSWYLTKITSPKGKVILFNYDLDANGNSLYLSNDRAFGEDEGLLQNPLCINNIHENVYLKEIKFADSLTSIKVNFIMEEREDLRVNTYFNQFSTIKLFPNSRNLKRYKSIQIVSSDVQSTLNKNIVFSQSYFNSQYHDALTTNEESELQWMRGRLDRLTINDQEYTFNYYKGQNGLPNKQTKAVDHFGFYNGQDGNAGLLSPTIVGGVNDALCNLNSNTIFYYKQNAGRLPDFDFGQAGLLKKITYPTRGYTVFEYEGHTYMPEQNGIVMEESGIKKAGGARIKSIKDFNYDNVVARQKTYRYTPLGDVDLLNSTGRLMTPLLNIGKAARYVYGDPSRGNIDPGTCNFIVQSNSSIPGNNAAEGKIIGYSWVQEWSEGGATNYKNSYHFENEPNHVLTTLLAIEGSPSINGQTIETRNYNSEGKIVQQSKNSGYDNYLPPPIQGIAYHASEDDYIYLNYFQEYNIRKTFTSPTLIKTIVAETPSGITEGANGEITSYGNSIETQKSLIYNANFLLKSQEITGSKGEIRRTEIKRPSDYTAPSGVLAHMLQKEVNLVEPTIEEINYENGKVISASANLFGLKDYKTVYLKSSLFYIPKEADLFNYSTDGTTFSNQYKEKVNFVSYDTKWNIQEYRTSDGITNSFIWGYNGKLPVVHGLGMTYAQLSSVYNDATISNTFGSDDYEIALRNNPISKGKQIATYLHNPFVGISSSIDPTGRKKTFQYDLYSRLNKVIDQDGKTLEQYQYHFRERLPTRIISLSGDLNFGTLTPDMFAPQFLSYARCTDLIKSKILRISNQGEDDLEITNLNLPYGFTSSWKGPSYNGKGEIIPAGESMDVIVSFNPTVAVANYGSEFSITSNKTQGTATTSVSVLYQNRTCSLTAQPLYNFGTTTGNVINMPLLITNNGNAAVRLIAAPLNWNGSVSSDYSSFISSDFEVLIPSAGICIEPGASVNIAVNFKALGSNGLRSAKLSLITDINPNVCQANYKDIVTLQADLQRPFSRIVMSVNTIDMGAFTEAFKTKDVTISNTGSLGFQVNNLQVSNPAFASYFSMSPSNFALAPNASQIVTIKFQPVSFDQNVDVDLTIDNYADVGEEKIHFTGKRYSYRKMVLSTSLTNGEMLFNYTGEPQWVTIRNEGNVNLNVMGITPLNENLSGWSIDNFTPGIIAPMTGTLQFKVVRTTGSMQSQLFTIASDKNDNVPGSNTFTAKMNTRELSYPNANLTMPFLDLAADISTSFQITNSGNMPISISQLTVQGIDPSLFTATIDSYDPVLANGGTRIITIKFSPLLTDRGQKSADIKISSDATNTPGNVGYHIIHVTGVRTDKKVITLLQSELVFDYQGDKRSVSVRNDGNAAFTLSDYSPNNSSEWGATSFNNTQPVTIAAGATANIEFIMKVANANPQLVTFTCEAPYGNKTLTLRSNKRILNLSGTTTIPPFTGSTSSTIINLSNNSSSTMPVNVTGISSSIPGLFSIENAPALSFNIAIGQSQPITVKYTPPVYTATDAFIEKNADIYVYSNATNGSSGYQVINVKAKRDPLSLLTYPYLISISTHDRTKTAIFKNDGNVNVTISSIGLISSPAFAVTYQSVSGGQSVPLTQFPYTLTPGALIYVNVTSSSSTDYSSASGVLRFTENGNVHDVNLSRSLN